MCDYAEMYSLIFGSKVMGYRVFIYINGRKEVYDFQTEDRGLLMWCIGSLRLHKHGNLLLTNDEVTREVKPVTIRDKSRIKELLNQVQHYYQLRMEG